MSEKSGIKPPQAFIFPTELPLEEGSMFVLSLAKSLDTPEIEVLFGDLPAEKLILHAPNRIYGLAPRGKEGTQDLTIRSGKKILLQMKDAVTRSRSPKVFKPKRPKKPGKGKFPAPLAEKDPFQTGPASNWWMLHQDLQHTSNARSSSLGKLTGVWQQIFRGFFDITQPIFAPNLVLIGCGFGGDIAFTALDFFTGEPVWTRWKADNGNRFVLGTPVAIEGRVFFVEENASNPPAHVTCLDIATGAEVWSQPLDVGWSHSALATAFGLLYGVSASGHVVAWDVETGTRRWQQPLNVSSGAMISTPAVMFGSVYVGSETGLHVFNAINGNPGWVGSTPQNGTASPAIVTAVPVGKPAVVAIGADDNTLYAYDAGNGNHLWQYQGNTALYFTTPSSSEDGKYYLGQLNTIVVLDVQSGNVIQTSQNFGANVGPAPTITDDNVLVVIGSNEGNTLLILDRGTLAILDSVPVNSVHRGDHGSPSVLGDYIFICDSKVVDWEIHASIRCFKG